MSYNNQKPDENIGADDENRLFRKNRGRNGEDPYDLFEAVRRSVAGDPDSGLVFCSENAGLADKIDTVKDVFREFTTQKK